MQKTHLHGQVQWCVAILTPGIGVGPMCQQYHGAVKASPLDCNVQSRVSRPAGQVHLGAVLKQQPCHLCPSMHMPGQEKRKRSSGQPPGSSNDPGLMASKAGEEAGPLAWKRLAGRCQLHCSKHWRWVLSVFYHRTSWWFHNLAKASGCFGTYMQAQQLAESNAEKTVPTQARILADWREKVCFLIFSL